MSYWPALDCPSWNALAKNESYGSVRNSTVVPVASWNIGRIVDLNGARAPSSKAPITSLPPAFVPGGATPGRTVGAPLAAPVGPVVWPEAPHAARTALVAATPPIATPRRSTSRLVRYRDSTSSSLTGSALLWRWSALRRPDGPPSCRPDRRSMRSPDRCEPRRAHPAVPSSLGRRGP